VEFLGAKIVKKRTDADIDLSLDTLEKDSFMRVFPERTPVCA